ncbi:MAG: formylmethanofuran dehydrogenase [Candidatus Omnitrophica bacterium]|nr:formylmethanofuran dehydrogenase [Candidatus Omnitrophota bacterium]
MKKIKDPRREIRELIARGEMEKLLDRAAEIHGHYCSHMALGVRATCAAFRELGITESTGMEEILAVVECNNCFVDGIQAVSGCTLGNNAMIYKDLGKTAVTFARRDQGEAVRVVAEYDRDKMAADPDGREAAILFDKAVKQRKELDPGESARMRELWTSLSFSLLEKDEKDILNIKKAEPPVVEYAPIFESAVCSICGEKVMETRAGIKDGKPVCSGCSGESYWVVAGRGIHPVAKRIIND